MIWRFIIMIPTFHECVDHWMLPTYLKGLFDAQGGNWPACNFQTVNFEAKISFLGVANETKVPRKPFFWDIQVLKAQKGVEPWTHNPKINSLTTELKAGWPLAFSPYIQVYHTGAVFSQFVCLGGHLESLSLLMLFVCFELF